MSRPTLEPEQALAAGIADWQHSERQARVQVTYTLNLVLSPEWRKWPRDVLPPCLDNLGDWQRWYDTSCAAGESTSPCSLCTRQYQHQMRAAGRCENPGVRLPH